MPIATLRENARTNVNMHHTNTNSSIPHVLSDIYCGSSHRNMTRLLRETQFQLFGKTMDIKEWPKKCQAHCWHCRLTFDTVPCSLPWHYDEHQKTFHMKGLFCSWSCAKRYCLDQNEYNSASIVSNMKLLAIKYFGHPANEPINPAPPFTALDLFGGPLTPEQYKAYLTTSTDVKIIEKPFYNFPMALTTYESQNVNQLGQLKGLRKPPKEVTVATNETNTAQHSMYNEFLKKHQPVATTSSSSRKRKARQGGSTATKKRTGSLAKFIKKR